MFVLSRNSCNHQEKNTDVGLSNIVGATMVATIGDAKMFNKNTYL